MQIWRGDFGVSFAARQANPHGYFEPLDLNPDAGNSSAGVLIMGC
jgi:hypothetical protein